MQRVREEIRQSSMFLYILQPMLGVLEAYLLPSVKIEFHSLVRSTTRSTIPYVQYLASYHRLLRRVKNSVK